MTMIEIKFHDRFVHSLWSGDKTKTTRRSKKGIAGDTFIVDYPEKNLRMKFEITHVIRYEKPTCDLVCGIYQTEGFYSPSEFWDFLADAGYLNIPIYVHYFKMVGQGNIPLDFSPERHNILTTSTHPHNMVIPKSNYGFGVALDKLKAGKRQQREGWNGKGMYIELQVPDEHSKMSLPYIYMKTAQGDLVPWLASQSDLLSEDWCNYEGK